MRQLGRVSAGPPGPSSPAFSLSSPWCALTSPSLQARRFLAPALCRQPLSCRRLGVVLLACCYPVSGPVLILSLCCRSAAVLRCQSLRPSFPWPGVSADRPSPSRRTHKSTTPAIEHTLYWGYAPARAGLGRPSRALLACLFLILSVVRTNIPIIAGATVSRACPLPSAPVLSSSWRCAAGLLLSCFWTCFWTCSYPVSVLPSNTGFP